MEKQHQDRRKKTRWKFGIDQTKRQEQAEIQAALASGRAEAYIRGQTHARTIEAELERRRARRRDPKPRAA